MTHSSSLISGTAGSTDGAERGNPRGAVGARWLTACGAIAGPLFVIAVLVQALTRPGFTLTRDAASLLDDGPWGWVQSVNFIVTGLLFIVAAAGLARLLRTGPGRSWIPRLLMVAGAGLAGGGIFHPDPSGGFPPGTPAGASAVSSWHGVMHEVCGSAAFLALIVVCFILARRFSSRGQRLAAVCSLTAGVLCAAGVASGGAPHGSLTLFIGVSAALAWIAVTAVRCVVFWDGGLS
jgi:hypothetical protein